MSFKRAVLDLLFPPKCVFCAAVLDSSRERICPACAGALGKWRCERAGKAEFLPEVAAALFYEGKVRESLHRYKFTGRSYYADCYAALLAEAVRTQLTREFDTLTYVPLSKKRRRKRGYDQAQLLAEALGRELGMEAVCLLQKHRDVPAQSSMKTAAERRANISGCYALCDGAAVEGRRILLVDDIFTTGSTLSEAARVLLMGGCAEVLGAAVACGRS